MASLSKWGIGIIRCSNNLERGNIFERGVSPLLDTPIRKV
jgi:hypothetical protein